jgi:hypothetical protein
MTRPNAETPTRPEPSATADHRPDKARGSWLREPLLHFLLLGAVVFAVDYTLASLRGDLGTITLNEAADAELKRIFSAAHGRDPDASELQSLRQRWFDNELLYREGLALGLDRGDNAIRERVIFKALNIVQADLRLPEITDDSLQAWFEQHRSRYDDPARVDFLEAVISGKPSREIVEHFVLALNEGLETETASGLRVFKGRPQRDIEAAFGTGFAKLLSQVPTDSWQVLESTDGPRAIRVEARRPPVPATFAAVREQVLLDWRDQRMQELRTDAVRALSSKYRLRVAGEGQ